jgi:hypothetical protein
MMRGRLILLACVALAACGQKQKLKPPANAPAPPKPVTSPAPASADDLLKHQPSERPNRSDELLTKSEPRQDDPFDQPPK